MDYDKLLEKVRCVDASRGMKEGLQMICDILESSVEHYDWVGFYIAEKEELVLGPYSGAPTDHTSITFGKGVCGQVALSKEEMVVQDVSSEDNYLSCSIHVRSEAVIPLLKEGELIAELDIDSHSKFAFTSDDMEFLRAVRDHASTFF